MAGPCGWPETVTCGSMPDAPTSEQQLLLARLVMLGAETLWRASGRRYGVCPAVVRPLPKDVGLSGSEAALGGLSWGPLLDGGVWRNIACTIRPAVVRLPGHVRAVTEVRIAGVVLDPAAYRVDGHSLLVRQDGLTWPTQDTSKPAGEPGTWTVSYTHGLDVGPLATAALTAYVCELWKASTGEKCRLPARVEGIFRQGVNIDFSDDNLDLLSKGRTGIPEADSWLALVNPGGATGAPSVHSPDLAAVRVTSWTS